MTISTTADAMFLIETERLALRHLSIDDADMMFELLNEPSFIHNIGDRGVRSGEQARAYIQNGPIASYQRHGFGLNRVALRDAGPAIGICGLLKREHLEHPDIGFALLPRFWSRGYALEAAQAVIAHARQHLGLQRILATTALDNSDSIRLLERIDFRAEGMIQSPGYDEPSRLFAWTA
ncbi:MAG: GNAT family N-acetyltransferase [Pseudomonadota bacterium]|nr:GNAT family N-acetyltransferase [Pseudomonadota bacterium]